MNLVSADLLHQFNFPLLLESSSQNPAQRSRETTLKTGYREQFGLAQLAISSIGFSKDNYGVQGQILSFDLYRVQEYSVWYSHALLKYVRAGLSVSYKNQWIKSYGSASGFSPAFAMLYQDNNIVLNFLAKDLVASRLFSPEYQLSSQWTDNFITFSYHVRFKDEVEQVLAFAAQLGEHIQPSVAYHLNREALAFSVTLCLSNYELRYSMEHHPDLGESIGITLAMRL